MCEASLRAAFARRFAEPSSNLTPEYHILKSMCNWAAGWFVFRIVASACRSWQVFRWNCNILAQEDMVPCHLRKPSSAYENNCPATSKPRHGVNLLSPPRRLLSDYNRGLAQGWVRWLYCVPISAATSSVERRPVRTDWLCCPENHRRETSPVQHAGFDIILLYILSFVASSSNRYTFNAAASDEEGSKPRMLWWLSIQVFFPMKGHQSNKKKSLPS